MKKTILTIVLAMLCLIFQANAQDTKAIDITTKGIQIGQQVPNVTINNIHNYKTTSAKLSDFKGKLVIIDFWATWCSPCVAMIPKMDSLQTQFGENIQFLSVTFQTQETVLPFLKAFEHKKGRTFNIPAITGDTQLGKLFPHLYLPHYVWVGVDGIVKAITEHQQVTAENIKKALSGRKIILAQKQDMEIAYDKTKPLFLDGNGGNGTNLIAHSVLTAYTEGLAAGYTKFSPSVLNGGRIILRNLPLLWFFKTAYTSKGNWIADNRMLIEVSDPTKISSKLSGNAYNEWLRSGNGYCYELILPKMSGDSIQAYMQADLKRYFPQYHSAIEQQERSCWVLRQISKKKTIVFVNNSGVTEMTCDQFIRQLNTGRFQDSEIPLINGVDVKEQRIKFDFRQNFSDIGDLNKLLEPLNLKFVKEKKSIGIVAIRDSK